MTIRILSGVGDPEVGRALATLLSQLKDTDPGTAVPTSTALVDRLDALAGESTAELPEVVLVHELIGPMPALDLVRQVALRFPEVGVILLTQSASAELYSAAMDSGARGLVHLPLSYEELAARVHAAATWAVGMRRHLTPGGGSRQPSGPEGRLITVSGAKGGVGTTVIAAQLALAARAAGRTTALVDLDLQAGDVASYLDVRFRRSIADLVEISDINPQVLREAMFTLPLAPASDGPAAPAAGLSVLLAPADGERAEDLTDQTIRGVISALRARFEVIVMDCGTQMNSANAVAVESAETAVLVLTPDVIALRGAKRMLRMWERLQIRKAEETVTVVNRHTRAAEIQPALVGRITATRAARTAVPAAVKELQPVVDSGRLQDLGSRSTLRQAMWMLAAELGAVQSPGSPAGPPAEAKGNTGKTNGGRRARRPRGGDAGQVSIEFLGLAPTILVVLALIWQFVLVGYTFMLAGNAADNAARAAAIGQDVTAAAKDDLPAAWAQNVEASTASQDGMVKATVRLKVPVLFPGGVDFPYHVTGEAGAAREVAP